MQTFPQYDCWNVIYSNSPDMILQHDIFSWEIDEEGNPCWLSKMNSSTRTVMKEINHAILSLSIRERKELTNFIFDCLEEKNIRHLKAIKYYLPLKYLMRFK